VGNKGNQRLQKKPGGGQLLPGKRVRLIVWRGENSKSLNNKGEEGGRRGY